MTRLCTCICACLLATACGDDAESGLAFDGGNAADGATLASDASLSPTHSAYLRLIRQEVFREDDAFAAGGTGRLYLFAYEGLPADTRERFANSDGETCTYESGTEWPTLPSFDQEWPVGDLLSAGELRFEVADGPNTIVFEDFEGGYLRKAPAPVMQGSFTHNSFFDSSNLPSGKSVTMSAQGGTGLGAFGFSATLPADYTVSTPDMETGNDVIDVGTALAFAWTPGSEIPRPSSASSMMCLAAVDRILIAIVPSAGLFFSCLSWGGSIP